MAEQLSHPGVFYGAERSCGPAGKGCQQNCNPCPCLNANVELRNQLPTTGEVFQGLS